MEKKLEIRPPPQSEFRDSQSSDMYLVQKRTPRHYTKTISERSQSKTHHLRKIMSWCHENVLQSLALLPNKNLEEMGDWLELARANHVETVVNSQASCGMLKCCGWPRRSSEPSSPTNGSEPQILGGLKDIQQSNNSIPKKSERENLSDINSKDSFRNLQPLIPFAVVVGPIISDSALNALWLELFCHRFSSWASGLMPANARAHAGSKWSHPAPIYQSRGHTWCKLPQKSSIQVLEKVTNLVQT